MREGHFFGDKWLESLNLPSFLATSDKNRRFYLAFLRQVARIRARRSLFLRQVVRIIASTYFSCAGSLESLNLPTCRATASKNPCAKLTFLATSNQNPCATLTFLATSDQNPCARATCRATAKKNPCAKAFPPPLRSSCTLYPASPRLWRRRSAASLRSSDASHPCGRTSRTSLQLSGLSTKISSDCI